MSQDHTHERAGIGKILSRFFLGAVMVCMVASLAMMDFGGMMRGEFGNPEVAHVGNEGISVQEFGVLYNRTLEQSGLKPDAARQMGLPTMVAQQEAERLLLIQAAKNSGIRISDETLARDLHKQLEQVKIPGTPKEKLQMILARQNISEHDFAEILRGDYALNAMGMMMGDTAIKVPESMILAAYRGEREKRVAQIVTIPYASIKAKPLDDATLQSFYDEHKESYRTPEKRTVALLILPQKLHAKEITISDQDAENYFKDHSNQFMSAERVKLEQVIVEDEAAAKDIAKSAISDLSSFKSDKAQYLSSDWYSKTSLPKELVNAIYPARTTGIKGPIRTALGWHVIHVAAFEDAKPQSFATVKEDIKRLLKDEELDTQINSFTDELDTMISNGETLAAIAEKYGLKTKTIADIDVTNANEKFKTLNQPTETAQRFLEAAFGLDESEISPLMDVANGDFALLEVSKISPSYIPELKTIETRVRKDAEMLNKQKSITAYIEDLIRQYKPDEPGAFEALLKNKGLTSKRVGPASRADMQKEIGKEETNLLFTLSPDNNLSYTQKENGATLVWMNQIVPNLDTPDNATKDTIHAALRKDMMNEWRMQFMQSWKNELGVKINQQILQQLTNPAPQNQN